MNRKRLPYDAVVIGGGAAGLVTATLAARLGARTALVERERLGGDCTWHGCIPSKTLLRSAATAQAVRNAGRFGIATGAPRVVWSEIRSRLDEIRERIYREADAPEVVAKSGIEVIFGAARFVDARAVRVPHTDGGEAFLAAGRFFICSGSAPKPFPFDVPYLTSETIFDLDEQPKRLLIVGAGPLGIESAQAFARLGSEVHVVTRARRILPRDDAEHAATLQAALEAEGVRFTFEAEPVGAELVGDERRVSLRDGTVLAADAILSAIGRVPRIAQLGVEAAGVRTRDGAIAVDARGRTSAPHIFAVGDATGPPYFTHGCEAAAKVAVAAALLHLPGRYERATLPWCTFTDPELAHAGATEGALRARGQRYAVYRFPYAKLDRALVDGATTGEVKLFVSGRGPILGASVLGARAGELCGELALAIRAKLAVARLATTVHPYPTYALALQRAADQWYLRLLSRPLVALIRLAFGFRGRPP